jgi:hypothetical protein
MRIAANSKPTAQLARGATIIAVAGLACGLIGCAQIKQAAALEPPPVNPSSPIAGYAEQVSRQTFPDPDFKQIPPKPADVRAPAAYKIAIVGEVRMRRDLAAWRATHPQLSSDPEAWADLQRHRIPPSATAPLSVTHDAESEAFARRLREEATKSQPQQ